MNRGHQLDELEHWHNRAEKAEAEVERLREELERVNAERDVDKRELSQLKAQNKELGNMASHYGRALDKKVIRLRRIEAAAQDVVDGPPNDGNPVLWISLSRKQVDRLRAVLEEEA